MKKYNAEQILAHAIPLLIDYLQDLSEIADVPETQFAYGEKTAYTECLEILGRWNNAAEYGLNFDVEKRFPL